MPIQGLTIQGAGFESDHGGAVAFYPDANVFTAGPIRLTDYGLTLGPLELLVPSDTQLDVQRAEIMTARGESLYADSDGLFDSILPGTLVAGAATKTASEPAESEDRSSADISSLSRRGLMKSAVAATGLYAVGRAVTGESPTLSVMELEIVRNPGGFRIRIDDVVEGVLPANQAYTVVADGATVDSFFADGRDGVTIGSGVTGTISIHTRPDTTFFENIRALISDDMLEYSYQLQTPADTFPPETEVDITSHPVVVDALRDAGGDESTFWMGDASIPHRDEATSSVGSYGVRDAADHDSGVPTIVYKVGSDAPRAAVATLKVRVDAVDELLDDVNRRILQDTVQG